MKVASGPRLVFGYLGLFLIFEGIVTLCPLILIAFYPSEVGALWSFLIPGLAAIGLGLVLFLSLVAFVPKGHFSKHEDSVLLVLIWISAVVVGSFPFEIASLQGGLDMTYSESFFEAMSAYSTTGLSVFRDFLDSPNQFAPHVFLFHRAFMQFVGGVGLVLIVSMAINDRFGMKLYYTEGHNDKLLPSLGKSAKLIFSIYFIYIVLGSLALWLAGMDPFEAVCHSISALSTGGFSTRSTNVAFFVNGANAGSWGNGVLPENVLAIELIIAALMILGSINFMLHAFLLRFRFKQFFHDCEIRFAAIWIVLITFVMSATVFYETTWAAPDANISFSQALLDAYFFTVSSVTTTGFSTVADLHSLGAAALFLSIICMIVGGGMGSTSGAIKQYRIIIIGRDLAWSFSQSFKSSRFLRPKVLYRLGECKQIDSDTSKEAHNFAALYLLVLTVGCVILVALPGIDVLDGSFTFASTLSGTGLSSFDFLAYKTSQPTAYIAMMWVIDVGLLLGRLEIMPMWYLIHHLATLPFHKNAA